MNQAEEIRTFPEGFSLLDNESAKSYFLNIFEDIARTFQRVSADVNSTSECLAALSSLPLNLPQWHQRLASDIKWMDHYSGAAATQSIYWHLDEMHQLAHRLREGSPLEKEILEAISSMRETCKQSVACQPIKCPHCSRWANQPYFRECCQACGRGHTFQCNMRQIWFLQARKQSSNWVEQRGWEADPR